MIIILQEGLSSKNFKKSLTIWLLNTNTSQIVVKLTLVGAQIL